MFYIDASYNGGVKISFICKENGGNDAGFCVFCNHNLKNQVQNYNPIVRRNYLFSPNDTYHCGNNGDDSLKLELMLKSLDKKKIAMLENCVKDITRGFNRFKNSVSIPLSAQDDMLWEMQLVTDAINRIKNLVATVNTEVKEEWEVLDNDSISREDMSAITKLLSCNDKAEYKGEVYRLHNNNGNYFLEHLVKGGKGDSNSAEVTPHNVCKNVRKFVRMALMKNDEKFSCFINGNFYPIINEADYNGKKYAVIQDDNGIAHNVLFDRIEYVNVFTEPPLN